MSSAYSAAFDWARRQVDGGRLPTAVLGIADADGVIALDAFGATNGRIARVEDHYPLFSVTKPLMGITAMRAIERGLLTPETALAAALPDFGANRDDTVRLRHLASHTSGITEPPLDDAVPLRQSILTAGRDFAAGTVSRYSTLAFEGIAALTQHATGVEWDRAVQDWAAPIGANGFTLDPSVDPHAVIDAEAVGFRTDRFRALRSPGAGLLGRASDLLAVGAALLRGGDPVLSPPGLAMMLRPLTEGIPSLDPYPPERGSDWGFTWNLRRRAPGLIDRDVYGHGGWAGAEFWIHPTAGVVHVLLTNRAERPGVDGDELHNAVVSAI